MLTGSKRRKLKFANKVISIVLSNNELYRVKDKARWNEDKQDWKIPLFYFQGKDRDVSFPTIKC